MTMLPENLPSAAQTYLDAFPAGDIVAFPIHQIDRIGLPVWIVALFPEDAALDGIMPYGVGYGMTENEAVLGALGEIAEMVFPTLTLQTRPKRRASYNDLLATFGARSVADPFTLCLPAGSPVGHDATLEWVEATRWADGTSVLVPVDLAAYSSKELSPGYAPFTNIISNGMGAGPDLDWAIGHGLCELLQRDGNGLVFRALDRGIALDLGDGLAPSTCAILDRFSKANVTVLPKFATDEFGFANLYCVGWDADGHSPATPIMTTGCGEASHPDRTAALDKALTEFAASRTRKAFAHGPATLVNRIAPPGYIDRFMIQAGRAAKSGDPRAFATMRDWTARSTSELRGWLADSVHAVRGHRAFDTLPLAPAPDGHARSRIARQRVEAAGFDILYVDMSPPGSPIACVKVIVPGLEVETMSYARIGERNTLKLLENDIGLIHFGAPSNTRLPVRLTPEALDRVGGQPLFDVAHAAKLVGPLYPLYREPEAHHVITSGAVSAAA